MIFLNNIRHLFCIVAFIKRERFGRLLYLSCWIMLLTLWNLSKHTNSRTLFRFIRRLCWLTRRWLIWSWLVRWKWRCLYIWWGQRVSRSRTRSITWSWLVIIISRRRESIFKSMGWVYVVNFLNIEISSVVVSIKLSLPLNCIIVFFVIGYSVSTATRWKTWSVAAAVIAVHVFIIFFI